MYVSLSHLRVSVQRAAEFAATDSANRIGTIFFNPRGVGGAGTEELPNWYPLFPATFACPLRPRQLGPARRRREHRGAVLPLRSARGAVPRPGRRGIPAGARPAAPVDAQPEPVGRPGWRSFAQDLQVIWQRANPKPPPTPPVQRRYGGPEQGLAVECSDSPSPRRPAAYPGFARLSVRRSGILGCPGYGAISRARPGRPEPRIATPAPGTGRRPTRSSSWATPATPPPPPAARSGWRGCSPAAACSPSGASATRSCSTRAGASRAARSRTS
jgi:hypothetical protein